MATTDQTTLGAGRIAFAIAWTALASVILLILFYAVGGPFGAINDVGNGALGILSAVLAWRLYALDRPGTPRGLGLVAAALGAAVMVIGSVLIITDVTGWLLAGLVSSFGGCLIGTWLLGFNGRDQRLPRGLARWGIVAGLVMLTGLLSAPGIVAGTDDTSDLAWYVALGNASWLGIYLLYPLWAFRLGRLLRVLTA